MKICIKCGLEKPHSEYSKAARMKDGHRNDCIQCRNAYHRMNSKKHYLRTRVAKLEKVKQYNITHREERATYAKAYCQRDYAKEASREKNRRQRADKTGHPHRAFLARRYYARRYNNAGYCSKQQLAWRWEYYGHKCYICLLPATETDHVIPVSKDGTNWPANLRPICKTCNVRKGNKWPYTPQLAPFGSIV